jgi:methylenetetrahydrofolate--tRNA-(uracil-5-)-methyltransferase
MNANFGLFPPVEIPTGIGATVQAKPRGKDGGTARKRALAERALVDIERWLAGARGQAADSPAPVSAAAADGARLAR